MKNNDCSFDAKSFLDSTHLDAFLVSNHFNILYLSNFEGLSATEREAFIFITKKETYLITDGRYSEEAHTHHFLKRLITDADHSVSFYVQSLCLEKGIKTVGFEANDLTWKEAELLSKIPIVMTPTVEAFKGFREQKNKEELMALSKACEIGDSAFKQIIPLISPGKSEREIAWKLEYVIREKYDAEIAFDPIVATGANAAIPHYNTKRGEGIISDRSLLLIDFGVKWKNYCSDMTRMIAVGKVDDEVRSAYDALKTIQEKTKKKIKDLDKLSDIDSYCRELFGEKEFTSYPHSTGHGVGLEVHEGPKISAISKDKKKENQVFTIEPGIYQKGEWGMRLEDTGRITSSGEFLDLTQFSRELIQV